MRTLIATGLIAFSALFTVNARDWEWRREYRAEMREYRRAQRATHREDLRLRNEIRRERLRLRREMLREYRHRWHTY